MKWLEDLSRSLASEPDIIPKGWVTSTQAAKIQGTSEQTQLRVFRKGIKAGIVQTKKFTIRLKSGKLFPVVHYGPKQ